MLDKQFRALREAAQHYNWRQCEVEMFGIYTQLQLYDGMRIAIEQLAEHLDTFERYHPDITWVREWFAIVHRLEPRDVSEQDFPFHSETRMYDSKGNATPGSTAFMDGITLMQEAFDVYIAEGDPQRCLNLAKGVIGSSVLARTLAYAADNCPEAWQEVQGVLGDIRITDEYSMEELAERNKQRQAFNECTNDYQKELWLALADQMEKLLA
jgi:hypothetical protein